MLQAGMKVLFTYDYGQEKMKAVEALGYKLLYVNENEISNTEAVADIDALICYNPFERLDISELKQLKWIQLSSIGIDQAPKEKVKSQNILLTNNRSGYSIPMGEWIVMNMLQLLKNSKQFYQYQSESRWSVDTSILELYNKTVCFVGTGTIATEAAKRLQGFEARVLGINTSGRQVQYFDQCFPMNRLDEVLGMADVVVLSIPFTQETYHLIDMQRMNKFKKGACLINISRGSIINEQELAEFLSSGYLRGAALDVFEEEPLPSDSPLWQMDNVIITPHNSWISEMRNERRYNIIYENLRRFINQEKLMNIVDIGRGY